MPNMSHSNLQCQRPPYDLSLTGMDCTLPSVEEQAKKKGEAYLRLKAYIASCGGELAEGWDCAVRCRITARRSGRLGVTTDNYYYSPNGQTFRNHKQVAEFMGLLQPSQDDSQHNGSSKVLITGVTGTQTGQQGSIQPSQSLNDTAVDHQISCVSDYCRKRPASSPSIQEQPAVSKRARAVAVATGHSKQRPSALSPVPVFDVCFAAQAARSAAFQNAALAAQAALMGPIATGSALTTASPSSLPQSPLLQQQEDCKVPTAKEPTLQQVEGLMLPPAPQGPKRTKAQLAAKYAATNDSFPSGLGGAAVDSRTPLCDQHSPCSSAGLSTTNSSNISSQEGQPAVQGQQQVQRHSLSIPRQLQVAQYPLSARTASSSLCTVALSAAVAVGNSTHCTASSPARQLVPRQQQQIMQQNYRTKELKSQHLQKEKQSKSYSARKQPVWRANLRQLAAEFAAGRGANSNSSSGAASKSSSVSQQRAL